MEDDRFSNENILKPQLLWCEGRCFRLVGDHQETKRDQSSARLESLEAKEMYQDEYVDDEETLEAEEEEFDIREVKPGKYEVSLQIPSACYGYIIGQGGKTKIGIENQTGTRIFVPKSGQTGNLFITGSKKDGVSRACQMVMIKVSEKRAKSQATHFVGIPVNTSVVLQSFTKFKDEVMEYIGLDELLFQSPMKLHITMGALALLDDNEVKRAAQLLEEFTATEVSKITCGRPIKFKIVGVNIMRDDPERTDVLYGQVQEENDMKTLAELGNALIKFLDKKGIGCRNNLGPSIKLHVTLMNSKFKKRKYEADLEAQNSSVRANFKGSDFFYDSRQILKDYKKFEFGCVSAERFRLCCCGSVDSDGSHQYVSEHVFVK